MARVDIQPEATLDQQSAKFIARLVGITPMLMHKPTAMKAATGEIKRSGQKNIPTPEDEAEMGAYRFDDGVLYLPSVSVQRSMIEAGKSFANPSNKRATMMKVIAATLVPPPVEGFPMLDPETEDPITDYEIDTRRAVVMKAAVMRSRPRLDAWCADVEMGFDLEAVGSTGESTEAALHSAGQVLLMVLSHAGRRVGVGDYRPERSGPFGRFEVQRFTVTDE